MIDREALDVIAMETICPSIPRTYDFTYPRMVYDNDGRLVGTRTAGRVVVVDSYLPDLTCVLDALDGVTPDGEG